MLIDKQDGNIFPCREFLESVLYRASLRFFISSRLARKILASTTRKFFFWSWVMCPIPARSNPVTESCGSQ